jgi:hypothetical protein
VYVAAAAEWPSYVVAVTGEGVGVVGLQIILIL